MNQGGGFMQLKALLAQLTAQFATCGPKHEVLVIDTIRVLVEFLDDIGEGAAS